MLRHNVPLQDGDVTLIVPSKADSVYEMKISLELLRRRAGERKKSLSAYCRELLKRGIEHEEMEALKNEGGDNHASISTTNKIR